MRIAKRYGIPLVLIAVVFGFLIYSESKKILSTELNSWSEDYTADCAVVLTGSRGRVREGVDTLYQGRVKKLIISGVYQGAKWQEIFPQWIYYGDVRAKDVILEKRSLTTFGNAQQSLALVEALGCRDILLMTSRLHLYRSHKIFNKYYPSTISIQPVAVLSGSLKPDLDELFVESMKSLFYSIWAY
jgi:uncharacterized SAM-binding protein YcdF (DUF218 family)